MDTWYCPRCKEHRRATKKFELWKTPDILVMHLKRFSSSGMRRDKLDVLVDFPIENLDLTSRVIETEEGKSEIYDLFAVDNHWGGLGGGHYTAFAKNYTDARSGTNIMVMNLLEPCGSNLLIFYRLVGIESKDTSESSRRVLICSSIGDDQMDHWVGQDSGK